MQTRTTDAARGLARPLLLSQTDDRLVTLARAGSEIAFEAIVRRYRRPLLAYARRLLRDDRAEDAVQHALLNAYRAMPSIRGDLELRPWLYRIVHNCALDLLRRTDATATALADDQDGGERPDEAFSNAERLREILAALDALPGHQRDAIVLRELEGRGHEEIARVLGVSGGAVRQLIHRARSSLRAAATGVLPSPLVEWLARGTGAEPLAARLPELAAAGAATSTLVKVGVAALVAGGMAGGSAAITRSADASRSGDRGVAHAAVRPADAGRVAPVPSDAQRNRARDPERRTNRRTRVESSERRRQAERPSPSGGRAPAPRTTRVGERRWEAEPPEPEEIDEPEYEQPEYEQPDEIEEPEYEQPDEIEEPGYDEPDSGDADD